MNPLAIGKLIAESLVGAGTGMIVGNLVKATTPTSTILVKKIAIGAGAFVLSSMVADLTTQYLSDQIDDVVEKVRQATDAVTIIVQEKK